jgi:hypothetical protein
MTPSATVNRTLAAYLQDCRWWKGCLTKVAAVPVSVLYVIVTWALFLPLAHRANGTYAIDLDRFSPFVYRIPDLSADFPQAIRALATAPFLNHDSIQLVYITVLVLVHVMRFERREGARRTALLFVIGLISGAFGAGLFLHLLYPEITSAPMYAYAWERSWSGGSAGCFAVIGALATRSRRPWLFLGIVVLWDLYWPYLRVWAAGSGGPQFDLVWWHVPHSFTSVFHLIALAVGYVAARYWLRPARQQ